MPENTYIQQAITTTKQKCVVKTHYNTIDSINFAKQMKQNIYAKQLELMRGSLGV